MKRVWYTDGMKEKLIEEGKNIPVNFKPGRLPRSEEAKKKQSETTRKVFASWTEQRKQEWINNVKAVRSNWTKNKRLEVTANMRLKGKDFEKGHIPRNKGKKGLQVAWNKGKHIGSNWNELSAKKQFETRLANNNFKNHDTFPELQVYDVLKKFFAEEDIKHPYRDSRYPFNCDFYIKSLDLFIEVNSHWTHGLHPFDKNNSDDINLLNKWKEKSKTSQFYKNAIETWTVRDVKKLHYVSTNNLNYIALYEKSSTTIENQLIEEISKRIDK